MPASDSNENIIPYMDTDKQKYEHFGHNHNNVEDQRRYDTYGSHWKEYISQSEDSQKSVTLSQTPPCASYISSTEEYFSADSSFILPNEDYVPHMSSYAPLKYVNSPAGTGTLPEQRYGVDPSYYDSNRPTDTGMDSDWSTHLNDKFKDLIGESPDSGRCYSNTDVESNNQSNDQEIARKDNTTKKKIIPGTSFTSDSSMLARNNAKPRDLSSFDTESNNDMDTLCELFPYVDFDMMHEVYIGSGNNLQVAVHLLQQDWCDNIYYSDLTLCMNGTSYVWCQRHFNVISCSDAFYYKGGFPLCKQDKWKSALNVW